MKQESYESLTELVTSGDDSKAIAAVQKCSLLLLRKLDQEYDLEGIAETYEGDAANLAVVVGERLNKARGHAAIFETSRGFHMSGTDRLSAVKECNDPEALEEALDHSEGLQNTVVKAIHARLKKLSASSAPFAVKPAASKKAGPKEETIAIAQIVDDAVSDLQMREDIDSAHVDDLKECLTELPPITVFIDCGTEQAPTQPRYYIGDGWHRFLAHKLTGKKQIAAIVHSGGKEAALRHALGANAEHNALRRTNRDKRKAVTIALKAFPKMSLRELGDLCRVSHELIRKIKAEVSTVDSKPNSTTPPKDDSTGGKQIDFWETFHDEANQVITTFRARLADAKTCGRLEQEPERTAQEFEALADALQHEATEIRKTATAIRTGLKA